MTKTSDYRFPFGFPFPFDFPFGLLLDFFFFGLSESESSESSFFLPGSARLRSALGEIIEQKWTEGNEKAYISLPFAPTHPNPRL